MMAGRISDRLDEAVALARVFTCRDAAARALTAAGWPTDPDALDGALSGGRLVHRAVSQARARCYDELDVDDGYAWAYARTLVDAARRAAHCEETVAGAGRSRMDAASAIGARAAAEAVGDLLEVGS